MKHMRIKIKHLLIIILAVMTVYLIISFLYSSIAHIYDKKGKEEYAAVYYEKAFNMLPDKFKSDKDIYDYANILSHGIGEEFLYTVFSYGRGGMGGGILPTDKAINKSISLYKMLLDKYPSSPWSKWASVRLCEIYMYKEDYDEALKYIKNDVKAVEPKLIYDLYSAIGEYEEGIALIKKRMDSDGIYYGVDSYYALADFYIKLEDYGKAIAAYKTAINELKENRKQDANNSYYDDKIREFTSLIERTSLYSNGTLPTGCCKGRVMVDGKGIMGVKVYIKDRNIYAGDNFFSSTVPYPYTLTDKNGFYSFEKVLPGEYDIGIGISPNLIIGKAYLENKAFQKYMTPAGILINNFEFNTPINIKRPADQADIKGDSIEITWENVSGADHYSIIAGLIDEGSSASFKLIENIRDNKVTVSVNEIVSRTMGFGCFADESKPTKGTLLGIYSGGKILYGIEAYDKNGKMIASTMPILKTGKYPRFFTVYSEELEGDKLIKSDQYDKAAQWFETYLQKNPEDIHSLYVLSRYHMHCTKDYNKSVLYLKRLYAATGDEQYKSHIFFNLWDLGKYEEMIKLYNESSNKEKYHDKAAMAYAKMKELKKAYELYEISMEGEHSNNETIRYILLALLNGDLDKAKSAVKEIDEAYSHFQSSDLLKHLSNLKNQPLSDEFRNALTSYITYKDSWREDLKRAFEKSKAGSEKEILNMLCKYEYISE